MSEQEAAEGGGNEILVRITSLSAQPWSDKVQMSVCEWAARERNKQQAAKQRHTRPVVGSTSEKRFKGSSGGDSRGSALQGSRHGWGRAMGSGTAGRRRASLQSTAGGWLHANRITGKHFSYCFRYSVMAAHYTHTRREKYRHHVVSRQCLLSTATTFLWEVCAIRKQLRAQDFPCLR